MKFVNYDVFIRGIFIKKSSFLDILDSVFENIFVASLD